MNKQQKGKREKGEKERTRNPPCGRTRT
jgi:hypothetical protein